MPTAIAYRLTGTRLAGMIRTIETWFDDDSESLSGFDLWISHQRSRPMHSDQWLYFYTIQIDLTAAPDQILNQMKKTTIKEIKRAADKDNLIYSFIQTPTDADIDEFATFFDANPRTSNQPSINRARLLKLNVARLVQISKIQVAEGPILVWRCNLTHEPQRRIQPLFGASIRHNSQDRTLISLTGRANRLLHYREMLHYKGNGYLVYDWNGWYAGTEDEKRLQINQFKEGFGGQIKYGYDCEEPLTMRGRLYLLIRSMKWALFQPDVLKERKRRKQQAPRLPQT